MRCQGLLWAGWGGGREEEEEVVCGGARFCLEEAKETKYRRGRDGNQGRLRSLTNQLALWLLKCLPFERCMCVDT